MATFTQAAGNVLMGSIVLMDWNRSHELESFSWTGIVLMDWNRSHGSHGLESFSWTGIVLMEWTRSHGLDVPLGS